MSNEKLIERLRDAAALPTGLYAEAANALEAAEKRIAELEAERENFHMEYRMKCDEETKRLERKLAVAREAMDKETLLRKMNEVMDDVLVEAAASMMRHKLSRARDKGRGGWWNPKECTAKELRESMEQHIEKGDPVDVMNLAAMVAVREMLETPNF